MVSTNRDIRVLIFRALKDYPWLTWERGGRHARLRNERTRDFIPIALTPSDFRATKNLRAQVRRLAEQGLGVIAARRGH